MHIPVDFLAVDEAQLAADRERGHIFTERLKAVAAGAEGHQGGHARVEQKSPGVEADAEQ